MRISPRAEDGFGLVEVIVAATIVVLSALGLYAGLDSSERTSSVNKLRSSASTVAQADQERLRALTPGALSNYRETRTVTAGGATFTLASRGDWVTDATGDAGCTSGVDASYLKVTSKVTWAGMTIKPVALTSLVAVPNGAFDDTHGSLAVEVTDAAGNPQSGVAVSVSGNGVAYSDTTNDNGCVLWGELPAGNYPVTVASAGVIDRSGHAPPTVTCGVVGGDTSTCSLEVGAPGTLDVSFDTDPGTLLKKTGVTQAARGNAITIANSGLDAPGYRAFSTGGPLQNTVSATSVFPFSDAYAVYAGDCPGADPRRSGDDPAYVTMDGTRKSATVREPSLNLQLTKVGTAMANVPVTATATATGCSATTAMTTNAQGQLVKVNGAAGTDNGLPYGTYDLCLQVSSSIKLTLRGVNNGDKAGTAVLPVDLTSSLNLSTASLIKLLTGGLVSSTPIRGSGSC